MPITDLPPEPPAAIVRALEPGDLEIRLGTGTNPRVRGNGGWALWAVSWWGFEGSADLGLLRLGPFSIAGGTQLSYGQPFLLQTATNGALAYFIPEGSTRVVARSVGMDARGILEFSRNDQARVHPYFASAFGPRWLKVEASRDGSVVDGSASWQQLSWGFTPSAGLDIVLGQGFVLNGELGWSEGVMADADSDVSLNAVGISVVDKQSSGSREAPRGVVVSTGVGWQF
ncbi:MAG: hypothetical protein VX899_24550 [Myxococcota bacterium]|nr:hypothetical protein [Myxococcota bacterium]